LWEWLPIAGFYDHKIQHPYLLTTISWRAGNPYALCELSGRSVDLVLSRITASELAESAKGRCTRIDLATDIDTALQPSEFCGAGYSKRILSTSTIDSPSGQTVYIGSRKGERMARVYRYHAPHPRSHLLRVEVELKGEAAKGATSEMSRVSLIDLTNAVNLAFDWQHPLWLEGKLMVSKIPARAYDNDHAQTLRWLRLAVTPAMKKLHANGAWNIFQWLADEWDIHMY